MKDPKTLFQHGTLALLVPGLFDGTITMEQFMQHGDTGIGTGEGLDGELIVLDGVAYQIDGSGHVNRVGKDFTLPFGNLHFADYQPLQNWTDLDFADFPETVLKNGGLANVFFSIRLTGTFKTMQTRSIDKQARPYPTLADCATHQHVFDGQAQSGTVIAYYAPQLFNGSAVGGFHSHFLASDLSQGGHILNFTGFTGQAEIQVFDTLAQSLPTQNAEFRNHDFTKDDIAGAIEASE